MTSPIIFRIPPTPVVDQSGRLTPEWLMLLNRLGRAADKTPDDLLALALGIQQAQSSSDDAFALAQAANSRPIPDIELPPIYMPDGADCELLPVFVPPQLDDAELLPVPVRQPDMVRGWAQYADTTYTQASPFVVIEGATGNVPNNAGLVINQYLPLGVASFYDGTKITPDIAGDYCIVTIRCMASCTKAGGYGTLSIDIGGAQGKIFPHLLVFPKGATTWHPFDIAIPCYMLDTFKANGGVVKLDAQLGDISIATIAYQITRVSSP